MNVRTISVIVILGIVLIAGLALSGSKGTGEDASVASRLSDGEAEPETIVPSYRVLFPLPNDTIASPLTVVSALSSRAVGRNMLIRVVLYDGEGNILAEGKEEMESTTEGGLSTLTRQSYLELNFNLPKTDGGTVVVFGEVDGILDEGDTGVIIPVNFSDSGQ
ncbi:MAG: hypothetical protein COV07_02125 [Candidatus Vogelbacteria bacterium CG10_big_fil_rev_8_21_14_0_10_45_14]|uniref:Uncharacterized protein n=1 Tax=Candidatus Vogelbacteria bacterium CG10_big_fil_rev_8_21_14_0_10_45_14 TaxID=1975042 RepID=A0A2H0RJW6_9BACT|nr:MAG: hypothetical protein COV07_02125 [Candidatus Vogelbacteria bacterium CG10_big_fil_rev_8_21_14_0_10_45_14]